MTISARLAFAAPLALGLAACGDTTEVDDRVVDTAAEVETPPDVTLPKVPVEYPEVPLNARTTVDYAGTYELHNANGEVSTIVLREDSYTWRAADGTETSGSFTWGPENDRILIERAGETQAYAVAQNVLYRLPSADAPADGERSEETTWRRSDATPTDGNQADIPAE
jgi:hypothetical protein